MLAAVAAFTYPIWNIIIKRQLTTTRDNSNRISLDVGLLAGLLAFVIHSMLEVHLQVPALMATAAITAIMLTLTRSEFPDLPQANNC